MGKQLAYRLYGIIFNLFRVCPVKQKKVVLFMVHNSHFRGNLRYLYEAMKKQDEDFRFVIASKADIFSVPGAGLSRLGGLIRAAFYFYVTLNYHMATAEYIFLNDNFLPLAFMKLSKKTKLIQLWHGVGAFKRFGLSTESDPGVRNCVTRGNRKVTYQFVSAKQVIPYHAEAMGIPPERIIPAGLPVLDYYFDEEKKQEGLERFYGQYPELRGKKILLYTPTFRDADGDASDRRGGRPSGIFDVFDCTRLQEALGPDWVILVRQHPMFIDRSVTLPPKTYDVTFYDDVRELLLAADILVNDYSSIVVEFALLRKPIILYAYDLADYDRGFYCDYRKDAPGTIVTNMDELIETAKNPPVNTEKTERFLRSQYDYFDGGSTERVLGVIFASETPAAADTLPGPAESAASKPASDPASSSPERS